MPPFPFLQLDDEDASTLREVLSLALDQSEARLRDSEDGPADLAYWDADDHNKVVALLRRIDSQIPAP